MNENWMPVVGWEKHYEVSDQGHVRSLDRYVPRANGFFYHCQSRVLRPAMQTTGYLKVNLRGVGEKQVTVPIHTLVLTAFGGPRPRGNVARHLNGNPLDNRAVNLCWGTAEENMQDAIRHGTNRNSRKTHCIHGHEFAGYNLRFEAGTGRRVCRTCANDAARRYQQRRRTRGAA